MVFASDTLFNYNGNDLFVVKYDSSGVAQWVGQAQSTGYSSSYGASANSVYAGNFDNVYVAGRSYVDIDFGNNKIL